MEFLSVRMGFLGAFFALTACGEIVGLGGPAPLVKALPLYSGDIVVGVPEGYCVVTQVSRPTAGFAVLAACDAIAGGNGRPPLNGVVTVQVGVSGSAFARDEAQALAALFDTASGRALLSQTGAQADVTVQGTEVGQDAVTVRFADAAPPPVAGLQDVEWRGFFGLESRLTTVSVRGLAQEPFDEDEGQRLLEAVITAVQIANDVSQTPTDG